MFYTVVNKYYAFNIVALAQDPIVTITESDPQAQVSQTGFFNKGLNGGLIQVKRDLDVTMSCYVENKQVNTLVRYLPFVFWNLISW